MNLLWLGQIAYTFYLPVFLMIILVSKEKFNHFSFAKNLMSELAETISPVHREIDVSIFLFGLLRLVFVGNLGRLLPPLVISKIGLFFLCLSSFSCLVVGFFPRDKFKKIHGVFGTLFSVGIVGSFLFLIYPILVSSLVPHFLIVLNISAIAVAGLLMGSDFIVLRRLDGFVSDHRSFWQWLMISLVLAWDFIMAVLIILHRQIVFPI